MNAIDLLLRSIEGLFLETTGWDQPSNKGKAVLGEEELETIAPTWIDGPTGLEVEEKPSLEGGSFPEVWAS